MTELFGNLQIDLISFGLGLLTGVLIWVFLGRLRPLFSKFRENVASAREETRIDITSANEIRLGNDILRRAQTWHLASDLFSLDEIIIQPHLLAPPLPPTAYEPPSDIDHVTDSAIPYLLDWPELASFYGAPDLSILEALQGGANLAITGRPGSGKTVALAYLACQVIQRVPEVGNLSNHFPILLHVTDLVLPPHNPEIPLETIIEALSDHSPSLSPGFLKKVVLSIFNQQRALLLLDGLDELSPSLLENVAHFLKDLLEKHPSTRMVLAASPYCQRGLVQLGIIPLSLVSWDIEQHEEFISRWAALWNQYIATISSVNGISTDAAILVGWLLYNTSHLSPLELTLKTWAAFAGDSQGPGSQEAVESYLLRMMHLQPKKSRPALEHLAGQMVHSMQPIVSQREAEAWLTGSVAQAVTPDLGATDDETPASVKKEKVRISGALSYLLDSRLIFSCAGDQISFSHPSFLGFLAGFGIAKNNLVEDICSQPDWEGRNTSLGSLASMDSRAIWMDDLIADPSLDILQNGLLLAGSWLRGAHDKLEWIQSIMRKLTLCLQKDSLPLSLRARAMIALALSGKPGVAVLFRQFITSQDPVISQLSALGAGLLRDGKAVAEINKLVNEKSPPVHRAALLALVAIEDKTGLEAVAYAMLHGEENRRRAAAQALANNPEEGFPTLQEGTAISDSVVRRAALFGVACVNQPWAIDLLENIRAQDVQWLVQDAANQLLDFLANPNPHIPRPLPSIIQTPWLISFAAERGMGVAPGQPAFDLLYQALREGNEDQRLAAMFFLYRNPTDSAILPLYQLYFSIRGELRESTFETLWSHALAGITLPPPNQYGFR